MKHTAQPKYDVIGAARAKLAAERGTIRKSWGGRYPIALAYPNSYYVGMSSLGYQTIYGMLNEYDDVVCERVFWEAVEQDDNGTYQVYYDHDSPATALEQMKGQKPLAVAIESQHKLTDFACIAFSISFEPDYFHVVQMLRSAGIPLRASERDERYPLIICGGPCVTGNPEPIAPFFDAIAIGEAEPMIPGLVETLMRHADSPRSQQLAAFAELPGWYVPQLYTVDYTQEGSLIGMQTLPGATPKVQRQYLLNLDDHPTRYVVITDETEFSESYLLEVARGCGRGCRFCLAGYAFLPQRERSIETLLNIAREGMQYRDKLGLVGPSVSDYTKIDELAVKLREIGAKFTIASLRADNLSPTLVRCLVESGSRSITLAPEAGSDRMRALINKTINEDDMMRATDIAGEGGLKALKLYFIIGFPDELDEDVMAIADLTLKVKNRLNKHHPGAHVKIGVTPFVPKAATPFQWMQSLPTKEIERRARMLNKPLKSKGVQINMESPRWTRLQSVLSRGDRRVADVLERMARPNLGEWDKALRDTGIDPNVFLRERHVDEWLPWNFIDLRVRPVWLKKEAKRASLQLFTKSCPPTHIECHRCGVC